MTFSRHNLNSSLFNMEVFAATAWVISSEHRGEVSGDSTLSCSRESDGALSLEVSAFSPSSSQLSSTVQLFPRLGVFCSLFLRSDSSVLCWLFSIIWSVWSHMPVRFVYVPVWTGRMASDMERCLDEKEAFMLKIEQRISPALRCQVVEHIRKLS